MSDGCSEGEVCVGVCRCFFGWSLILMALSLVVSFDAFFSCVVCVFFMLLSCVMTRIK